MSDPLIHPWFQSTTGLTITSHNGSPTGHRKQGTLPAFRDAYLCGYRWFQVDATPIIRDLISCHAIFGRRWGFMKKSRGEIKAMWPEVPTLRELLDEPSMPEARWNIELKSKKGLPILREQLRAVFAAGFNPARILISSPMRPSVVKGIRAAFPDVAIAAPVIHGGFLGVRFLGRRLARVDGRPYDCQQIQLRFVRSMRARGKERPVRQAWTARNTRVLDRVLKTDAQPIVDSRLMIRRAGPGDENVRRRPASIAARKKQIDVLALGGGGWRGAFGGIGAVMYLDHAKKWQHVKEVVGISGGAFAVGALSSDEYVPADVPGPAPQRDKPDEPLTRLLTALEHAGRMTAAFVTFGAIIAVAVLALLMWGFGQAWGHRSLWALSFLVSVLLASSFVGRLTAGLRWTAILKTIYRRQTMRVNPRDVENRKPKRYAIGSTGLNDGRLYSFTTNPHDEYEAWLKDTSLPTPLGGRGLSFGVVRASSLPGIGQLSVRKLWLAPYGQTNPDSRDCDWVPDRLGDAGFTNMFGDDLATTPANQADPPLIVVVDAGRKLPVNNALTLGQRLSAAAQRILVIAMLARWLKVGFEGGYRKQLAQVEDDNVSDGYCYRLVRLAEEEDQPGLDEEGFSEQRLQDLNRLYVLRDQLHRFSLIRANRTNANRALVVAIAACALEFQHQPDIVPILQAIGTRLGRQPDELAQVWTTVRVPLLALPQ